MLGQWYFICENAFDLTVIEISADFSSMNSDLILRFSFHFYLTFVLGIRKRCEFIVCVFLGLVSKLSIREACTIFVQHPGLPCVFNQILFLWKLEIMNIFLELNTFCKFPLQGNLPYLMSDIINNVTAVMFIRSNKFSRI